MPDDKPVGAQAAGAASGALDAGVADQLGWPVGCAGRVAGATGAAGVRLAGVGCHAAGCGAGDGDCAGCCHAAGGAAGACGALACAPHDPAAAPDADQVGPSRRGAGAGALPCVGAFAGRSGDVARTVGACAQLPALGAAVSAPR